MEMRYYAFGALMSYFFLLIQDLWCDTWIKYFHFFCYDQSTIKKSLYIQIKSIELTHIEDHLLDS